MHSVQIETLDVDGKKKKIIIKECRNDLYGLLPLVVLY